MNDWEVLGDAEVFLQLDGQLANSFHTYMDMQETTPLRDLATLQTWEFEDLMKNFTVFDETARTRAEGLGDDIPEGVPPTAGQRAKVVQLFSYARIACGFALLPSEQRLEDLRVAEKEAKAAELQLLQASKSSEGQDLSSGEKRPPTVLSGEGISPAKKIKMSSVTSQTDDAEVSAYTETQIQACYSEYENVTGAEPSPAEDTSSDQISVVGNILDAGGIPSVDLAVFGPFATRFTKKDKLVGMMWDPSGQLIKREIPGPSSFELWEKRIIVFFVILIMKRACTINTYQKYLNHVRSLHETYGRECWPLLYQCETRVRGELFERILRRGKKDFADSGPASGFDPNMPMDYVLRKAVGKEGESNSYRHFWHEEFERPQLLLSSRAKSQSAFVDGDAPVAPTAKAKAGPAPPGPPPAALTEETWTRKANRPSPGSRTHLVGADGKFTHNRSGWKLCEGFLAGTCTESISGGWCSKNQEERHQCSSCLSPDHASCGKAPTPPKGAASSQNWKTKGKGGKGGKSKGKGGRKGQG